MESFIRKKETLELAKNCVQRIRMFLQIIIDRYDKWHLECFPPLLCETKCTCMRRVRHPINFGISRILMFLKSSTCIFYVCIRYCILLHHMSIRMIFLIVPSIKYVLRFIYYVYFTFC